MGLKDVDVPEVVQPINVSTNREVMIIQRALWACYIFSIRIKFEERNRMSELAIYQSFVAWLGKTWWGLPESDQLLPLIKARYTVEEAAFLTGISFSGNSLEDLANSKGAIQPN